MPDAMILRPSFRTPAGSFRAAERPLELLAALVAGDGLVHREETLWPALDDGPVDLPWWNTAGFVWPYRGDGKQVGDPADLLFMLLGFDPDPLELCAVDAVVRDHVFRSRRYLAESAEVLPGVRVPAGDGIAAVVPLDTDPHVASKQISCRTRCAELFAAVGGLSPPEVRLLVSTGPCRSPLAWDEDGPPRTAQNRSRGESR